jgi:thiamine kinase
MTNTTDHQASSNLLSPMLLQSVHAQLGQTLQWQPLSHTGTTNALWVGSCVGDENPSVVLRISPKALPLGASATREKKILTLLSLLPTEDDLAQAVPMVAEDEGWLVMPYLESKRSNLRLEGQAILALVKALKSLPPSNDESLYLDYEGLWQAYRDDIHTQEHIQSLDQVVKAFNALPTLEPWCVHHDLHPGNCLYRGNTPILIDWEYAGFGQPWADFYSLERYWKIPPLEIHQSLELGALMSATAFEEGMQRAKDWMQALETLWVLNTHKEA